MNRHEPGGYHGVGRRGAVLVTGGAGYIGSRLVPQLLSRGYRVHVLDRLLFGDSGLRGVLDHSNFELITADFRDVDAVMKATERCDAVIHLGAIVGDAACELDEELTLSTNVGATAVVADACRRHGISRLIFVSTCSVYGASAGTIGESSPLNPCSLYAKTKIASEQHLLEHVSRQFTPVILRLGTAFGMSPRPRFDLVVNLLTAQAVAKGLITIHGGAQWRPFIHVDDIGRALVLTLEAPLQRLAGQIFNVGANEHNYQLRDVGAIVGEAVPTADVVTLEQAVDPRNYFVRFDKIDQTLGFRPIHSVRDGVHEMKRALELGLVDEFSDRRHYNHLALRDVPRESWQTAAPASAPPAMEAALLER